MRHVVLSGFMGSGKSSVGRALAARLGRPFVDTDEEIAKHATRPTAGDVFAELGEPRFREMEAQIAAAALARSEPHVIAFGGGTVTARAVRWAALDRATLVTLDVPVETSLARVASSEHRPNLAVRDPGGRAAHLLSERRAAYAECHARVDGTAPVEEIVRSVEQIAGKALECVPLGERTYVVEIAPAGRGDVASETIARLGASSRVIVTDKNVHNARFSSLPGDVRDGASEVVLEPGEHEKTIAAVERIWDAALTAGIDRRGVVVAFGGGVVGDLAGFAAATLLRGVRFVQIPTTLLAMVDASVGGKTGFDRTAGKNLVGAFHQPSGVVIDVAHLETLDARQRGAGLAEVVKIGLADDAALLDDVERLAEPLARGDHDALAEIVRRAVAAKIRVVRDDETERGRRAILNLGHTVGHALEAHQGYRGLLHGEAVAVGTVLELAAFADMGLGDAALARRAEDVLRALGLPTEARAAEIEAAWTYASSDKKRSGARVAVPVVREVGRSEIVHVDLAELGRAVARGATR